MKMKAGKCLKCFVAALVLMATLCGLLPITMLAEGDSADTIKVGSFLYDGFLNISEEGTYSGYAFDYLQEIAQYTGWKFEFVDTTWEESLELLESGEIDLMGSILKSPEREEIYDYSSFAMGSGYGVLVTKHSNEELSFDNYEAFDGIRVGVLKGNRQADSFLADSKLHNYTPVMNYYDTQKQLDAALNSGMIDAMVMTSVLRSNELRVITKFGEDNFYFATTKGNSVVLNQLNQAMEQIQFNDPYFNSNLNRKYFDLQVTTPISFTEEELEYIKNSDPIRCVYNPDYAPISYFDEKTKTFSGISASVCELIEKKTGLQFEYVNSNNDQEAMDSFAGSDVQIIVGKMHDFSWAQENNAFLTTPYLQGQTIMVTNGSLNDKPVIALYDQFYLNEITSEKVRNAETVKRYHTLEDCLDAVRTGDADATFVNSNVMSFYINNPKYFRLQQTPLYGCAANTCIAVDKRADPILVSILNKALGTISNTQISEIVSANMKINYFSSIMGYIYARPFDFTLVVGGVLLMFVVVLIFLFRNRAKSAREMKRLLGTDSLTGYPNFQTMTEVAPKLIGTKPEDYAMVYMDMHQFKYVNDTLGYDAGDRLLLSISDLIHKFIQKDELFARMYADKFVLLLRYIDQESFTERLDQLSDGLNGLSAGEFEMVNLLFSGGVYHLRKDACDLDMACDRANYAKDTIKEFFSNTFIFYDDVMRNQLFSEKMLEGSMERALENKEFEPFYQPKVNVITGEVVGAEALVRWNHPEQGFLSPGLFIPFYERNGFIVKIDFTIFEEVCRHVQEWIRKGNQPVPVSINFSRRHMLDKNFVEKLMAIVNRYQVPTHLLEIEITETVEVENMDIAVEFSSSLKECGFPISIDDYGTGYSSIAFLQELPFDVLKLDKMFIENAMKSRKAKDIMRHLVMAVKNNGMRVLCEGIETEAQRDFIIGQNCRFAQGFLYAKPMPRQDFEAYLLNSQISDHETTDFISAEEFEQHIWKNTSDFMSQVMPGGILACNIDEGFSVFYINEQMLADLGYSEYEFMKETNGLFLNAVHPDDRIRLLAEMQQNLQNLEEYLVQYRVAKKNGEYIWLRNIGKRIVTDDNREVLLCICTDVTDLVHLQEEQNNLINALPGGVCNMVLQENGPLLQTATDHFYSIIGHTREDMEKKGNDLFSVIYPADLGKAYQALGKSLQEGNTHCKCTFRAVHKDGSLHWILVHGTVRGSCHGKLVTAVCMNVDEEMKAKQDVEAIKTQMALAVTLTQHAVFEYDVCNRNIYTHMGLEEYCPPDLELTNLPESLIDKGFIYPDEVGAFRSVFNNMEQGKPFAACEARIRSVRISGDSPYVWVRVTLSAIFEEGRVVKAVGLVENIDWRKRMERLFAENEQYRHAMGISSILAYEVNLTKDTFDGIAGASIGRLEGLLNKQDHSNCYSKMIVFAANQMVAADSRDSFLADMCRENLLRLYREGSLDNRFEYRRLMPNGQELWVAAVVHLAADEKSGDVQSFIYYYDIQTKKNVEETMRRNAGSED